MWKLVVLVLVLLCWQLGRLQGQQQRQLVLSLLRLQAHQGQHGGSSMSTKL